MKDFDPRSQLDLLGHVEMLTDKINKVVGSRGQSAFARYPLTFGLLALLGAVMLSEGVRGVLREVGILGGNPWYSLLVGLALLVFTGTLYKKLDK